jgi:hypothetical protein
MSAGAWTRRRAKRDLRRGFVTRHVWRLRVSDVAALGYALRVVPREVTDGE